MSGNELVLDTNIILYYLAGIQRVIDIVHGNRYAVSVITEMELRSYPALNPEGEEVISMFLKQTSCMPLTTEIKEQAITLRRRFRLKLPDAIVLGTAVHLGVPLITADKGFKKCPVEQIVFIDLP